MTDHVKNVLNSGLPNSEQTYLSPLHLPFGCSYVSLALKCAFVVERKLIER